MLFVAYKQGSTRTHRVDNAVTCEEARNMVANWVGVGAEQVFLWWSASMIEDAFPQEARLLLDDDETLYEHGATLTLPTTLVTRTTCPWRACLALLGSSASVASGLVLLPSLV